MTTAQIKPYQGAPALILDGKPAFYSLMWGAAPGAEQYSLKDCVRYYAEAGVHRFTFDMGTSGSPPDWRAPEPGHPDGYDFSALERRFGQVLDADPQARFHLRLHLEMPSWWQARYPEECELLSDGRRMSQSFASQVWREQARGYIRALIAHLEAVGLAERVIAYQVGAGDTGEWVKGHGAMSAACGDYSAPMQQYFQRWLRQRYADDLAALQTAWADPSVSFDSAQPPSAGLQSASATLTFRDGRLERRVIDYYRCLAELCAGLVIDFCAVVKQAARGQALAGAFYGYLMELSWNSSFFGERGELFNSQYATIQRSGHLGLYQVLQAPEVDFLVSPYSYGFRGIGGDGPSMLPAETARLHGKLVLIEDDTRTHLSRHDHPNYGKTDRLEDSLAILKRNFAYVLTHAQGIWWLAGGGPGSPHVDLSQEPAFRPLIEQFQAIGALATQIDRSSCAQIAVLLDHESFFYESINNPLDLPLIFHQRLWGLPRLGAPFDTYLLQDFIAGRLPPYKLYLFINPFHLDASRREALKREIRRDQRVAVWIYAPGFLHPDASPGDLSVEAMTDLTGFTFEALPNPWGPLAHLTDFQHPITRGLPQDLTWGTHSRLGPLFHLEDPAATILGQVVLSQGRCRPGLGVKSCSHWSSIYSAAPNLPASLLRGMARFAGVHIYSDQSDVLYAAQNFLAVHTVAGGERQFSLPRPVELVVDLFAQQVVARQARQFTVTLSPRSTALFYTGPAQGSPVSIW